jgi:hypothetical protein
MKCCVVATNITGCGVCTACHVVHAVHTSQPEILVTTTPHAIKRCIFTDQFHNIVASARLSIRSLRMVQMD